MFPQLVEGHPHGCPHYDGVSAVGESVGLPAHHDVHPPVLLVERRPDHLQHAGVVPHQAVDHFPGALEVVGRGVGGHHRCGAHPALRTSLTQV